MTRQRFGAPLLITRHQGWVRGQAFSGNDELLVVYDFGFWRINLRPDDWERTACRIANRELKLNEWKQYFGEETRRDSCAELLAGGSP